ncbi:hypothetical protein [Treponema sp.]|uniref:hypothetical protein n=1 Tax=Treponema sp. TaxID=166 RepID=UPI00298E27EC|nr:hypothetical protein [Treponema sp.]MDY4132318.1 hypothetical protein [Treponema sp.]
MHEVMVCTMVFLMIALMLFIVMFLCNWEAIIGYRNTKFLDEFLKPDVPDEEASLVDMDEK